jgi:hypothetical protein
MRWVHRANMEGRKMHHHTDSTPSLRAVIATWLNEAHEMDSGDTWSNRRHSARFYWTAPIDVYLENGRCQKGTLIATGRDVSESGIGLRTRHEIPTGSTVLVCRGGDTEGVPGMVTACTQTVGGFVVGIKFDLTTAESE